MFASKLIDELGLLNLVVKRDKPEKTSDPIESPPTDNQCTKPTVTTPVNEPIAVASSTNNSEKIDKNEFRLLVKMLQAINHECQFDHIECDGKTIKYNLPSTTLVFHDINIPDNKNTINLSSLADLISDPSLKRPVWEKLKAIAL